jgi:mycothiol synthase
MAAEAPRHAQRLPELHVAASSPRGSALSPATPYEVRRREGEGDIAELGELFSLVAAHDGHRALGEHKWLDLVQGGRQGYSGFVAREASTRRLVGYLHVSRGKDSWAIEYAVHPDARSDDSSVARLLLEAALTELRRSGGGHVHLWVAKPSEAEDELATALGLQRGRDLYQMRCHLPLGPNSPRPAVALITRPFRPGVDEQAWLEVNNRAFGSHPEQGAWTAETIKLRESEPWFDPEGFLLYERDGRLAGSCWTKIHEGEHRLGEIYVISVDPDFQGLGLGLGLVRAGLDHLTRHGITTGMLYVDATNRAALGLYEKLGFFLDHIDRAYVTDLAPEAGKLSRAGRAEEQELER